VNNSWTIEQRDFDSIHNLKHMESLFTLGNGYLGLRGDLYQKDKVGQRGTFINGFYESGPIKYGEKAYGYAENWQTIIPLPEGKEIYIAINGKEILTEKGTFREQKRIQNLRESYNLWTFLWIDEDGLAYKGSVKSIVPFDHHGAAIFIWKLTLPDDNMNINIKSRLIYENAIDHEVDDPRLPEHFNGATLTISKDQIDDELSLLSVETSGSGLVMHCAMDHSYEGFSSEERNLIESDRELTEEFTGRADKEIIFIKTLVYSYDEQKKSEVVKDKVKEEILTIREKGIESILEKQKEFMRKFWDSSDVEISGNDEVQLSLRYNLFQLLQSVGRDGKRSIAAKGLSGSGYEGHYFWDAETYVLPFFVYTNPAIARSMLKYRISILDKAEARATLLGHKGILFPWRTINGEESSAYFPAGTAQYHINSDIALGLSRYLDISRDKSILQEGGAELLAGTARFWCDFGSMIEGKGFCFNCVTGPDEYTAMVDNNFYTNITAKENLKAAAKWCKEIVGSDEIENWEKLADEIYLPEKSAGVTPQDDSFLEREPWDFASTENSDYPLLLHYHPMSIYRKQVLKQADVVMAQALFRNILSPEQMKRNFDFYEQLTTGDSSLSACAQGINASWLGYDDLAWEYFNETLHTDRKDLHKNVFHGLHTASMGGSYLILIYAFLGLENIDGTLKFRPSLTEKLKKLKLKITVGNSQLEINLDRNNILYKANNSNIEFYHCDEIIKLKVDESASRSVTNPEKIDFSLFRPRK